MNSFYLETILKPKQVVCMESIYLQKDVMCVLPTGYGKSLSFPSFTNVVVCEICIDWQFTSCLEIERYFTGNSNFNNYCRITIKFLDQRSNISTQLKWNQSVCFEGKRVKCRHFDTDSDGDSDNFTFVTRNCLVKVDTTSCLLIRKH